MKNIVYIIINIINGKQYMGSYRTDNVNDGYLGSGLLLKVLLKDMEDKILMERF